jgi:Cobaltochelatase CobS subunit N terminal
MQALDTTANGPSPLPDCKVSAKQLFGVDVDMEVPAYL